ncbi:mycothiol synthase [Amycolatopsis sp. lyj-112]|uniref:mycothiol synthase n=1 Tax=Amycolatopsis sp. lyj-112 TaxID=2789288 RepID=UPI00397A2A7B
MLDLLWTGEPETEEIRAFLLAVREADGRPEDTGFAGGQHLLGHVDGELVAYAHLDTGGDSHGNQVAELFVHPDHRRSGHGRALVKALAERVAGKQLRAWAHGDHPAAVHLAETEGFERARELLILHADVSAADWPEPEPREGVTLRTFVPGQDEEAMVRVNARAFDWHPEQGALTADEVRATEADSWFDPEGFFLAEKDGEVIGFHWTKIHEAVPGRFGGEPTGEVYVVGIDPDAQGGGLGKALTLAGLRYLRDRGLGQVILYVEGDNAPALAVYSKLGFTRYEVDVQYSR